MTAELIAIAILGPISASLLAVSLWFLVRQQRTTAIIAKPAATGDGRRMPADGIAR